MPNPPNAPILLVLTLPPAIELPIKPSVPPTAAALAVLGFQIALPNLRKLNLRGSYPYYL
jgi:hypothetical protein